MRITSGEFRGRKLVSPDSSLTHPMGDREKLALFNSLGGLVRGASVLDLFAGSGALGLEALSRGARSATFVENARPAVHAIKKNIEALDLTEKTEVITIPVQKFLCSSGGGFSKKYDLILIDPPYDRFDSMLFSGAEKLLSRGGTIVLSHPGLLVRSDIFPGLSLASTRKYARAHISVYR